MSSEDDDSGIELDADGEYEDRTPEDVVATDEVIADVDTEITNDSTAQPDHYIIVADNQRVTRRQMSQFEYANILAVRTLQIAKYGNSMTELVGDPEEQAESELLERTCPLIIERPVGFRMVGGKKITVVEQWDPNTMDYPSL